MKTTLKAGTRKILLIDEENVERNKTRAPHKAATVGRVIVVDADGQMVSVHACHRIEAKGPVRLEYTQHSWLTNNRSFPIHAALVTEGEVVIDDDREEGEEPAAKASILKKPKAPTTVKKDK